MAARISKEEWMRNRLAGEVATGRVGRTKNIEDFFGGKSKLDKAIARTQKQIAKTEQKLEGKKTHRGRTSHANVDDSTCFDELSYRGGVVTATFTDGSVYQYDVDRETWQDWKNDPSKGRFFNFNVR